MAVFILICRLGRSQYSIVWFSAKGNRPWLLNIFPYTHAIKCFMDLGLHKNIFMVETLLIPSFIPPLVVLFLKNLFWLPRILCYIFKFVHQNIGGKTCSLISCTLYSFGILCERNNKILSDFALILKLEPSLNRKKIIKFNSKLINYASYPLVYFNLTLVNTSHKNTYTGADELYKLNFQQEKQVQIERYVSC